MHISYDVPAPSVFSRSLREVRRLGTLPVYVLLYIGVGAGGWEGWGVGWDGRGAPNVGLVT